MVTHVGDGDRLNEGRNKINHNHETHREAAETAKLVQEDKFSKIVDSRIDPTTTLWQQNLPIIWSDRVRMSIPNELSLEVGKVFQEQRREVSIFTKMEQVLHVLGIHTILRIILD